MPRRTIRRTRRAWGIAAAVGILTLVAVLLALNAADPQAAGPGVDRTAVPSENRTQTPEPEQSLQPSVTPAPLPASPSLTPTPSPEPTPLGTNPIRDNPNEPSDEPYPAPPRD